MDPFSVTAGCVGLLAAAAKTTTSVASFVRGCREARQDLAAISRQLGELSMILNLLRDENETSEKIMPESLREQICSVLSNCGSIVIELDAVMARHDASRVTAVRWAAKGKAEVASLDKQLDAHIKALNIALEVSLLAVTRAVKEDTTVLRDESAHIRETTEAIRDDTNLLRNDTAHIINALERLRAASPALRMPPREATLFPTLDEITSDDLLKGDTARILEEIARLRELLPTAVTGHDETAHMSFIMERYLDSVTSYAASEGQRSPTWSENLGEQLPNGGLQPNATLPVNGLLRMAVYVGALPFRDQGFQFDSGKPWVVFVQCGNPMVDVTAFSLESCTQVTTWRFHRTHRPKVERSEIYCSPSADLVLEIYTYGYGVYIEGRRNRGQGMEPEICGALDCNGDVMAPHVGLAYANPPGLFAVTTETNNYEGKFRDVTIWRLSDFTKYHSGWRIGGTSFAASLDPDGNCLAIVKVEDPGQLCIITYHISQRKPQLSIRATHERISQGFNYPTTHFTTWQTQWLGAIWMADAERIEIWDLHTGKSFAVVEFETKTFESLAFTPPDLRGCGEELLFARTVREHQTKQQLIEVWNLAPSAQHKICNVGEPGLWLHGARISPDGRYITTLASDWPAGVSSLRGRDETRVYRLDSRN